MGVLDQAVADVDDALKMDDDSVPITRFWHGSRGSERHRPFADFTHGQYAIDDQLTAIGVQTAALILRFELDDSAGQDRQFCLGGDENITDDDDTVAPDFIGKNDSRALMCVPSQLCGQVSIIPTADVEDANAGRTGRIGEAREFLEQDAIEWIRPITEVAGMGTRVLRIVRPEIQIVTTGLRAYDLALREPPVSVQAVGTDEVDVLIQFVVVAAVPVANMPDQESVSR